MVVTFSPTQGRTKHCKSAFLYIWPLAAKRLKHFTIGNKRRKTIEKDVSSASRRLRLLREDFENEMHQIEEDEKFLNELQRDGSAKAKEQMRHVMAQTAAHVRRARSLDEEIKMLTEAENDI